MGLPPEGLAGAGGTTQVQTGPGTDGTVTSCSPVRGSGLSPSEKKTGDRMDPVSRGLRLPHLSPSHPLSSLRSFFSHIALEFWREQSGGRPWLGNAGGVPDVRKATERLTLSPNAAPPTLGVPALHRGPVGVTPRPPFSRTSGFLPLVTSRKHLSAPSVL